jgi:hypothetical protein
MISTSNAALQRGNFLGSGCSDWHGVAGWPRSGYESLARPADLTWDRISVRFRLRVRGSACG